MLKRTVMHVSCCFDINFVPHVAALIESLYSSNGTGSIHLHLLHDKSVTCIELEKIEQQCRRLGFTVCFYRPSDDIVANLPPSGRYSPVIWYRLLLPEILASQDRVLYLDGDTIVLQGICRIWDTDLAGKVLAAVASPREKKSTQRLRRLGVPPDRKFFNSGVLLMDLNRMRKIRFKDLVFSIGQQRSAEITHPDQDALNLACDGNWHELHPKWNCLSWYFLPTNKLAGDSVDYAIVQEALASPAILHFEGSKFAKPWVYRSIHPHRHLYLSYRERAGWPLANLDGQGGLSTLLRFMPHRIQVMLAQAKHAVFGMLKST